eukprot:COSAG02_NODE_39857_length_412_cov_0.654952_1_plen_46_part_10
MDGCSMRDVLHAIGNEMRVIELGGGAVMRNGRRFVHCCWGAEGSPC